MLREIMSKNKNNFEITNSVFSFLGRELFRPPSYHKIAFCLLGSTKRLLSLYWTRMLVTVDYFEYGLIRWNNTYRISALISSSKYIPLLLLFYIIVAKMFFFGCRMCIPLNLLYIIFRNFASSPCSWLLALK